MTSQVNQTSDANESKPHYYTDEQWAEQKKFRAELRAARDHYELDEEDAVVERLLERYSVGNTILILLQRPDTKGFVQKKSAWAAEGLGKIKKGEHGLLILAPAKPDKKADVEEEVEENGKKKKMRYVWVRTYDKSQMEPFAPKTGKDPKFQKKEEAS